MNLIFYDAQRCWTWILLLQVSLHLICIRDEVNRAWPSSPNQQGQPSTDVHPARENHVASPFVSKDILEIIGNVLRPGTGAPPDLPAQIDSVSFQSWSSLYDECFTLWDEATLQSIMFLFSLLWLWIFLWHVDRYKVLSISTDSSSSENPQVRLLTTTINPFPKLLVWFFQSTLHWLHHLLWIHEYCSHQTVR